LRILAHLLAVDVPQHRRHFRGVGVPELNPVRLDQGRAVRRVDRLGEQAADGQHVERRGPDQERVGRLVGHNTDAILLWLSRWPGTRGGELTELATAAEAAAEAAEAAEAPAAALLLLLPCAVEGLVEDASRLGRIGVLQLD